MPQPRQLAGFILAMLFSIVVCAQTYTYLDYSDDTIRWRNLAAGPLWISKDPLPKLNKDSRFHEVKLFPGQKIILQVPNGTALRVRGRDGQISANDLKAFVSNGDALFIDTAFVESTDKRSLVLLADNGDGERLLQMERPPYTETPLYIALFLPDYESFSTVSNRAETVELPGSMVEIRREEEITGQSFWPVEDGQALNFEVEGPVNLRLQSRLRYSVGSEQLQRLMTIETRVDGETVERTPYFMGLERRYAMYVDGCAEMIGSLQTHSYDVPHGKHIVSFVPEFPIYANVSMTNNDDFLFPNLNRLSIQTDDGAQEFKIRKTQNDIVRDIELIALDNSFTDSGLAAAAKTRQLMDKYISYDDITSLGRHLISRYTFYRNVMPRNISNQPISSVWPRTRRLVDFEREDYPMVVDAIHQRAMLRNVSQAQFTKLSSRSVNDYRLPQRQYPTTLRLLVKRSKIKEETKFRLQFDTEDAREIRVSPTPLPSAKRYLTPVPHIGVFAAQIKRNGHLNRADTKYFISGNRSSDIVDVAVVELDLPAGIERVTLFDANTDLDVSVQYRASKPFRPAGKELIKVFQSVGEQKLFNAFVEYIVNSPDNLDIYQDDDQARLESYWTPLRRLLHASARRYEQTIAGAADWDIFVGTDKPPQDFAKTAHLAHQAESKKNWIGALENWAVGRNDYNNENRYDALIGQALALEALGESFISERLLRSTFYYEDGASHKSQAFQLLLERAQDPSLKLSLLAAAAVHHPDVDVFVQLIDVLIENGEYQSALDLGLIIPQKHQPHEQLLRSAYVQQDWRIMDYLLSSVADNDVASYWRGYQSQYQGDYDKAVKFWSQAGERGQELIEFLRAGIAIHDTLRDDNNTVNAWQSWQANHPGTHRWVRDETLVTHSDGAVTTYAVERDVYGRMYRSTPEQPGVIKIYGPTRVRISARLEYSDQVQELKDDWLLIRDGEKSQHIAMNSDFSVPGFRVIGSNETKMGRLTRFELDIGPGEHEIQISARGTPLFFNIQIWRPELPISVLPPITANAVASFTDTRNIHIDEELNRIQFIQSCGLVNASDLINSRKAQTNIADSHNNVKQWLATSHDGSVRSQSTPKQEALVKLNNIVWQAEQNKDGWPDYLARGEQLFQLNLTNQELNPLINRLRRLTGAQWLTLTNIERDAGIHIAEVPGWQPESPTLRVRKTLMGPVLGEERVVTGGKQLGLSFVNTDATTLDLSLTSMDIAFLPRTAINVTYSVGGSAKKAVSLSPQNSKGNVQVAIPSGSHNLRVGIEQPYANQYVKVGIRQQGQVLTEPSNRLYHVSTNETPIQFSVKGPAWLRIDELLAEQTDYHYAFVQPGWQRMVLKPTTGKAESLYRIHQRIPGGVRITVPVITQAELKEIPQAPLELISSTGEQVVDVQENIESVKKGTWSAFGSYNSRRNFDEDLAEADDKDEFVEARGEYRWFNEEKTLHHRSALLGRQRSDGGATLGANHRIVLDNNIWPYRFQFSGSVFGQDIESDSSSFETSINLSASASRMFHINTDSDIIPRLRVFWRSLSLEDEPVTSDQIDQDVFTRYKTDHKSGLTLSGLYLRRPWEDAQWFLGAGVTTNEGIDPSDIDHYQLRVGWRQQVGPGVLDGEFRVRRYLDDDDRLESTTRPSLRVKLDIEKWRLDRSRWQLSFLFSRDFDSQDNSIRLELGRVFSKNRGYRDFQLGETRFRRLREERYRQLYQ